MIPSVALRDTVTLFGVTQTGTEDRYGDPTDVVADGVDVRASVQPMDATEEELDRDTMVTRYLVMLQPNVAVDGTDRVEWRGKTMEVIGQPKLFSDLSGAHHYELMAREIEG